MPDQKKDGETFDPENGGRSEEGSEERREQKSSKRGAGRKPTEEGWPRKLSVEVAHRREAHMFAVIAHQLCQKVGGMEHPFKANRLQLEDLLFSLLLKTYFIFSSRRADPLTRDARKNEHIGECPAPNTLLWYLRKPELTPILQALIGMSSLPFLYYDRGFAIDSTHVFTETKLAVGESGKRLEGEWLKVIRLHLICGVSSQVVTAARATAWTASEKKYFEPLLRSTAALGFDVRAVMGDKNYITKRNLGVVEELKATPYITFKKNSVKSRKGSDPLWDAALESFRAREDEDLATYRERNIVETVNSVIKKKFGRSVRGVDETAQFNEGLCKVICYNLCRLNWYDLKVDDRPSREEWEEFIGRVLAQNLERLQMRRAGSSK